MRVLTERGLRWLVLSSFMTMGCTAHVYSPPSRLAVTDGPSNVEEGQVEIRGQYNVAGEVFGVGLQGAGASVRYGMTPEVEIVGTAHYASLSGNRQTYKGTYINPLDGPPTVYSEDESWSLYTGRVGAKWSPEAWGGHFAVSSGLGGGYSDAGGLVSTDLGFTVGYSNRYVVPFVGLHGYVSVPIGGIAHDISKNGAPAEMQTPRFTYGAQMVLGVQMDFEVAAGQSIVLMGGASCTYLSDTSDEAPSAVMGLVFDAGYRF